MLCFCHVEMRNGLYFALKSYTLSLHHPWEYLQLSMVRTLFVKWARNSNYLLQCMLSLIARLYLSRIGRKKKLWRHQNVMRKKPLQKSEHQQIQRQKGLGLPSYPDQLHLRNVHITSLTFSNRKNCMDTKISRGLNQGNCSVIL